MTPAPIPDNDGERLAALYQLLILDTPPHERFDKIVAFSAFEFEAPIVRISLIDSHRQWFKSKLGISDCETARDISFCAHASCNRRSWSCPTPPPTRALPTTPSSPGSRLSVSTRAPLTLASGHSIGTLCVIDTKPRDFDAISLAILTTRRDLVVQELTAADGDAHA